MPKHFLTSDAMIMIASIKSNLRYMANIESKIQYVDNIVYWLTAMFLYRVFADKNVDENVHGKHSTMFLFKNTWTMLST